MSEHEIMTVEEVAAYMRVSERTVYDWAQKGEIPCGKLGSVWRFNRSQITEWVNHRLQNMRNSGLGLDTSAALGNALKQGRLLVLSVNSKSEALEALIDTLAKTNAISDREAFARGIWDREKLMSTGIGLGIGIPHVRLPSIRDVAMSVAVCRPPLEDYVALDGQPVGLVFMIAARMDQHTEHLRLLSAINTRFKDESLRQRIASAKSNAEIHEVLIGRDSA